MTPAVAERRRLRAQFAAVGPAHGVMANARAVHRGQSFARAATARRTARELCAGPRVQMSAENRASDGRAIAELEQWVRPSIRPTIELAPVAGAAIDRRRPQRRRDRPIPTNSRVASARAVTMTRPFGLRPMCLVVLCGVVTPRAMIAQRRGPPAGSSQALSTNAVEVRAELAAASPRRGEPDESGTRKPAGFYDHDGKPYPVENLPFHRALASGKAGRRRRSGHPSP